MESAALGHEGVERRQNAENNKCPDSDAPHFGLMKALLHAAAKAMLTVQATASGWEEPSWFPLQKQDDHRQDCDFAEYRRTQHLLKNLVRTTDSNRRNHCSGNAPDSANDDRHEAVNDITLPQARPDVPDL